MRLHLLFGLLLMMAILFPGQMKAQQTRISLNLQNVTVNTVLNEIEAKTDYTFLVNQQFVDLNRKVDAVYDNTSVKEILDQLFKGQHVNSVLSDHQIILSPDKPQPAEKPKQGRVLKGVVTDSKTREPLPGVSILVKGTTTGCSTDLTGAYSLEIPQQAVTLIFSYLGYTRQEILVEETKALLNVELVETARSLDEVVVTALGVKREEKALGYAVQKAPIEELQKVKAPDLVTSLTGKIAGLLVRNSSNFGTEAYITLRDGDPLIVVDGIPTTNVKFNDLSQDDILSIDVLKGATASALYGSRGAGGAIMITTKRGEKTGKGLSVSVNSSTMFNLGFVVTPARQTSYSSGYGGKYGDDYIWGDKLDIGRTTTLWDPYAMEWKDSVPLVSKGKDNLKNFQQLGLVTNNNVNIVSQGENSSFRTSITHVFNKGQFPNQKLDKVIYTLGGTMEARNVILESNFSYAKHVSPNVRGNQYSGGYLYNLIGWLGAEWDIREYTDYWMVKDEKQNWFNEEWYDNPYFLANEVIKTSDRDLITGFVSASYRFSPWMKLTLRTGLDSYLNRYTYRNPIGARNAYSYYGYYEEEKNTGYSINNDLLLQAEKTFGNIKVEGLLGGTILYLKDDSFDAFTKGGISIPGYYSLKASVDPGGVETWVQKKQVNSTFGRASVSYKSMAYLDVTGRWDWSSTLAAQNNPYFYPSVAGSFVISELLEKVKWLDLWKVRSSWAMSKQPADIYAINNNYEVLSEVWGGFNSAVYPSVLKNPDVYPQTFQTVEVGTAAIFFKNRLRTDVTVYRKRMYDFLTYADLSEATGFYQKYVNTDEEWLTRGVEIVLGGTPVKRGNWKWDVNFNWSKNRKTYLKIDEQFTPDQPWNYVGARLDTYTVTDWIRDPSGNLVNFNGFPDRSDYPSVIGYSDPDWIWGLNSVLKYKDFSFSFSFDGRVGGMSFSRLDALLWNSGAHIETDNQWRYDEVVNGLKNYIGPGVKVVSGTVEYDSYGNIVSDTREFAPNDVEVSYESYIKDYYQQGAWSWCSQNILDETFIKLREVSLTYEVPASFSNKLKMKNLAISLVGQNLYYWGKEYKLTDPDYGVTWDLVSPSIRYVGFDLKFNI